MNRVSLKSIAMQISSGSTPLRSNKDFWDSPDVPWVKTEQLGVKNIFDSNEKISRLALEKTGLKLNPINTLSVAMYGEGKTRGSVSILKKEMTTNQACCNIKIDENKADYEYVYYYLRTQYYQLRNLSSGVRKNLNSNDIKNFEIRLPRKLETQTQIAKVLSDLDSKIELNNKINAELEATAKLIYDYWFVQFDFPNAKGKPYKASGGKMVWSEELKREIPEGWEVKQLSEILKHNYASLGKNGGVAVINYLDTSNLTRNQIGGIQRINLGEDVLPSRAQRIVQRNDILYSTVRPNQEHFGIIKEPIENLIASTGFAQLSTKDETIGNDLIYTFLRSDSIISRLQQIADSSVSAYPSISPNDILNLHIALPIDKNLSNNLNDQLDSIHMLVSMNQRQNQKLSELRDWLLPMLMNGQVKVGEVEHFSSIALAKEEELAMAAEPEVRYKRKKI